MMIIFFLNGLSFGGLGLAAHLQHRQGVDIPLRKHLPWLAAFGYVCGANSWVEMFLVSGGPENMGQILILLRLILQPLTGLLLLKFGWGIFKQMAPLPAWMSFIPGILIVPIAYVATYALTTFITPSPIEIPVDIWSRYLLYLPGAVISGAGFLRQWWIQRQQGFQDVSRLMLGAGFAFLFEALVVGLVVPAAPYGPASYYNYDRVVHNAFKGEQSFQLQAYSLTSWLDYESVLAVTGLPIEFWRMISTFAVTFFVVRGLDVFEAMRKRHLAELEVERDQAREQAIEMQTEARKTAEDWSNALVSINRMISQLENVDIILVEIVKTASNLLESDFVGLGLLDESRKELLLKCFARGNEIELIRENQKIKSDLLLNTITNGQAYRSKEKLPDHLVEQICPFSDGSSAQAVAIVPLILENQPVGAIWSAKCGPEDDRYSRTDIIWLDCLADQVILTIQHGLMTSKLQSLSVVEERSRIAREMHDGLAQVLGYLNLQVQTLQALQRQGKQDQLLNEIQRMREAVNSAQADVRENILSLRTTLADEEGLISALDEYTKEFSIQTGLEVRFQNRIQGELGLASIAEVQLICILQEALANVRKHARAARVEIELEKISRDEIDYVCMKVSDDGIGIQEQGSNRSFGMQTMDERASSVEGEVVVESYPDRGTTIKCLLPCLSTDQMDDFSVILSSPIGN